MHLDYEFELDGKTYTGRGVDIGDTIDIETEKENHEQNKKSAICHELNLYYGEDDEKIEEAYNRATFSYCELYN